MRDDSRLDLFVDLRKAVARSRVADDMRPEEKALRRLDMPEDLQEKHGFTTLGEADSEMTKAILGLNSARLYGIDVDQQMEAFANDRFAQERQAYLDAGDCPTRLAYGWVA